MAKKARYDVVLQGVDKIFDVGAAELKASVLKKIEDDLSQRKLLKKYLK